MKQPTADEIYTKYMTTRAPDSFKDAVIGLLYIIVRALLDGRKAK